MTSTTRPPVVVAVDGSPSSAEAVVWAAAEAGLRGLPLRLVHVYLPPSAQYPVEVTDSVVEHGRTLLTDAAAEVDPGVEVHEDLRAGWPVEQLIEASREAALLVTGHRGVGGFEGLLLGSVSDSVSAHAQCPVVVLRAAATEGGPVVIGVDGSESSLATAEFAFAEASRRRVPLTAVHTWHDASFAGAWVPLPEVVDWEALATSADLELAELLAGLGEKYPDVLVERVVTRGQPAAVLVERSAGASLLVVGKHGRHALTGLGMGSTARAVLHYGQCPVAVVRP